MIKFSLLCVLAILFNTPLSAQVVNTGGGGPDLDKKGEQKKEGSENPHVKDQRIKQIESELKDWMKMAKDDWNKCYKSKFKANDLIELYAMMSLQKETRPPQLRKSQIEKYGLASDGSCEETNMFGCFFQDFDHNLKLYRILDQEGIHDYLKSRQIDKAESRNQFVNFYKRNLNAKDKVD